MTALSHDISGEHHRPRWLALNAFAAFAVAVLLMSYFYSRSGDIEIGVPGHDSAYHIKMAVLIPEVGLVRQFPWLRFSFFTNEGHDFVSHHYGFHVLLVPFVYLSKWMTGDYMAGGRWAISVFVGLEFALFYLLLALGRVRWRWLWIALLVLMPHQFFIRHSFVRAISPSLVFMLLILLLVFRNRYLLAGLMVFLYTHLYLGAVMYAPVLIATFAAACLLGPRGNRRFPTAVVVCTAVGWTAGVLTYPYFDGMLEFLKIQVFGSGLSPDISVGREWKPYNNVWWFARMSSVTLGVWIAAIALRLRMGPRLNAEGMTLLLLSVVFLVLTLKARRFVEYWPMLSMLSAAYMLRPLIDLIDDRLRGSPNASGPSRSRFLSWGAFGAGIVILLVLVFASLRSRTVVDLLASWQLRMAAAIPLVVVLGQMVMTSASFRLYRFAGTATAGFIVLAATTYTAAGQLREIRGSTQCYYNLPAIREMMAYIRTHSQAGDVIFTDDWDTFPIFFYHNAYNHYIVGLDPKFTHHRRPDLWERYVKISRGRVPAQIRVELAGKQETIDVRLEDIRDYFGAKFVITDSDHRALAQKLVAAPHFAEPVFPSRAFQDTKGAPYRVFRIREPGEDYGPADPTVFDRAGILYLGYLDPISAKQGWGELTVDRAVGGGPISLGGKTHLNGLGTHAPSEIRYKIPAGYTRFQAVVGVDDFQAGLGSVIASVLVDGEVIFKSKLLTGGDGEKVDVPVEGASLLTLRVSATDDGMRCDHVNWASARLIKMQE